MSVQSLSITTAATVLIILSATGCADTAATRHSLAAVATCSEFKAASRAERIAYVATAEPSVSVETAVQIAGYLDESCRLLRYGISIDQTVLDNAVAHVTGRMPGEPPPVSSSAPPAGSTGAGVLGATDAEWNTAHQMDRKGETGAAYDPVEGLAEGMSDRFSSVIHSETGRVSAFYLALPPNTPIAQAVPAVMAVVPKDATHGPVVEHSECASMTIHSPALQTAVGSPDAEAFFGNGTSYHSDEVVGAEVASNPPESETAC